MYALKARYLSTSKRARYLPDSRGIVHRQTRRGGARAGDTSIAEAGARRGGSRDAGSRYGRRNYPESAVSPREFSSAKPGRFKIILFSFCSVGHGAQRRRDAGLIVVPF